jgi:hypothetical protein
MAAAGSAPTFCRPQNDFGSDEPESACKQSLFLGTAAGRRVASPEPLRPGADEQGDCFDEKDLQNAGLLQSG